LRELVDIERLLAPSYFYSEVWYTEIVRDQKTNYKYRRRARQTQEKAITKTYILDNDIKLIHRIIAWVAQLVEQGFCKPQVVGSNPIPSSRQKKEIKWQI
tara:strand:- start:1285 stop:1584 length:300 start_codon:yes stop_codon:yes gene_type:complete